MGNKIGKNTPVWKNSRDGRIVCGKTIQDALGVGMCYNVGPDWAEITSLPAGDRVVIRNGRVLPANQATIAIARTTHGAGPIRIRSRYRELSYTVLYADSVKVIIQ